MRKYDFSVSQKHKNPNLSCPNQKATDCLRQGWIQEDVRQFLSLGCLEAEHGLLSLFGQSAETRDVLFLPMGREASGPRSLGAQEGTDLTVGSASQVWRTAAPLLWPEGKTRQSLSRNPSPKRKPEGGRPSGHSASHCPGVKWAPSGAAAEGGPRTCLHRLATCP